MTRYPHPPIDETWPPQLERLVVAVRAPAQPGELAGEDAAAVSFREMRDAPRLMPTPRTLTRVLGVKVAAGAAVLFAGGYAVAAATGAVPGPPFLPSITPGPAVTTPGGGSTGPQGTPGSGPGQAPGADPTKRPTESYAGLCEAYFHAPAAQGTPPPMQDLLAAAGGVDGVADFCAAVGVPAPTPPNVKPKPSKTAKPTPARPTPTKPERSAGPPPERTPYTPPGGGPGYADGARSATA